MSVNICIHTITYIYLYIYIHIYSGIWRGETPRVSAFGWFASLALSFVSALNQGMCDMTQSRAWHDAVTPATWLSHMCDMAQICVWHDLRSTMCRRLVKVCVAWLSHMRDMKIHMCGSWRSHMCDMTLTHVRDICDVTCVTCTRPRVSGARVRESTCACTRARERVGACRWVGGLVVRLMCGCVIVGVWVGRWVGGWVPLKALRRGEGVFACTSDVGGGDRMIRVVCAVILSTCTTHIPTHTYTLARARTHTHTHVHTHIHTHTHSHAHTYTHTHTHSQTHTRTRTHTRWQAAVDSLAEYLNTLWGVGGGWGWMWILCILHTNIQIWIYTYVHICTYMHESIE